MVIYASSFTFNDHEINWAVSTMLYCDVHILNGDELDAVVTISGPMGLYYVTDF